MFNQMVRVVLCPLGISMALAAGAWSGYGKLPLSFEPNRGQTDARVQFLARGDGYTLFLSSDGAVLRLPSTALSMSLAGARANILAAGEDRLPGRSNYFAGKDPAKWQRSLETYRKVRYSGVYPGVDLVYYGTQGRLEYDFIVAPQADPSRIRLRFAGAHPVVDASGDLVFSLAPKDDSNSVRFRKPVLYQQVRGVRREVSGRFTIAANNEVGFEVGSYDRARELVIDPIFVYSSYLGGSTGYSEIYGMTINAAGEIYVTGVTSAPNYPTTPGVVEPTCPETHNLMTKCQNPTTTAFVSKVSADGQSLIYATYLGGNGAGAGGSGNDYGQSIAVDANDNAWVLGSTLSDNFPITSDAYQTLCSPESTNVGAANQMTFATCGVAGVEYTFGPTSLFIVKLNPTGTDILYGTFLGGSQQETPAAIALDTTGNVYVAGTSATTGGTYAATGQFPYPTTGSAYQTTGPRGGVFAFVTELTPDGKSLVYSTFFGSLSTNTYGQALAVNAGKIFLGGSTQDGLPTTSGALSGTCPTGGQPHCQTNGFVAEFDPTQSGAASLVFSTYMNGTSAGGSELKSNVTALAADTAGNVYVGGTNQYTNFPTTSGVLQPTCYVHNGFCTTGFVSKLGPAGALAWSTFYGSPSGAGQYGVAAIALDVNNNVYFTSNATSAGDLPLKNTLETYANGQAYVAELKNDGSELLFGTFYGSGNGSNVYPTGIAVDAYSNIYFAGYNPGGNVPLVNAYQTTAGSNDGFFAKIMTLTAQTITFGTLGNLPLGTPPFTVSAMATSGLAVDFNSQTPTVCTASGSQVTLVTTGTCTIQATQGGNTTFAPAPPMNQSFQVTPALNISSLGPAAEAPGGATFTLTVNGSGFLSGVVVDWNGTALVTTFVSATQLTAAVPASLIASAGTANVTVVYPGGAASNAKVFSIATFAPFGSFDTPATSPSNVNGSVGFTGWALSLAGISSVGIYRDPNPGESTQSNGLVYIGTASSITGSRTDIAADYPNYPGNTSAGWGFLILTNELPSNGGNTGVGNGTYNIHAIALDLGGNTTDLGVKTIVVDNKDALTPFGAIDTPAQGATVSGSKYVNFGWALTPQPKTIPTNGSTIVVYIDGKPSGHPVYDNPRSDIETLFPGYANTDGAVGYLKIDTTKLTNGLHSISWGVTDSAGQKTGVGSRFFIVQN